MTVPRPDLRANAGERPVALLAAMEEELAPFFRLLDGLRPLDGIGPWEAYEGRAGGRRVVAALSDCGPVNAAAACERLLAREPCAAVLSAGSAGAHDPSLLPGDVVIGSRYVLLVPPPVQEDRRARGLHPKGFRFRRDGSRVHFESCPASALLLELAGRAAREEAARFGPWPAPGWPAAVPSRACRVEIGAIGSADAWTRDAASLRALHEAYGTACEDMESAFLAQLCALHGVPFLSVRAIANAEGASPLAPGDVPAALAAAAARSAAVVARVAAAL